MSRWVAVGLALAGCGDGGGGASDAGSIGADVRDAAREATTGDVVLATCVVAGQLACGSDCVFPLIDEGHCGACDVVCGPTEFCYAGSCRPVGGSYLGLPTAASFVSACDLPGSARVLMGQDDIAVEVELPMDFTFFQHRFPAGSAVGLGSNGYLEFDGAAGTLGGSPTAHRIPWHRHPDGLVAPYWTDLIARGGVCTATTGAAPDRRWVVQWVDAQFYADAATTPARLNFEAILQERDGSIEFQYGGIPAYDPTWPVRVVTVGVESPNGETGSSSCNAVAPEACAASAARYMPQ